MKKIVLTSLMMVCLPFLAVAQSVEDDLYFIPKKKAEKKEEVKQEVKVAVPQKQNNTTVYAAPGSTVVVKDVKGNMRDVDEYNRRYTSRDNTFSMENDTLYIEEKPLNERGEWVNGFEGSQDDYEYAMRIVRFRNPRYAIPVSSPLYWDVVYGLPSWDWNVYDDGLYAYVFPTYTNRLWWDWRFNYLYGPGWSFSWGWTSPWYYSSWYPNYWYGGYWGGGYWGHHAWHHHHHYPGYGWGGGYWGGGHGWYGSSAHRPGIHAGRYNNNYNSSRPNRNNYVNNYGRTNSSSYVGRSEGGRTSSSSYRSAARRGSSSGRVVSGSNSSNSVRPGRTTYRSRTGENISVGQSAGLRNENVYTRPEAGRGSSYNRPSSTRSSVSGSSSYRRNSDGTVGRGAYRSNSNSSSSRGNSYSRRDSYSRQNSSSRNNISTSRSNSSYRSNSSSSSSRSSYSSGGSSVTFTVARDGKNVDVTVEPKMVEVESYDTGFVVYGDRVKTSPIGTLKYSVKEVGYSVKTVIQSLGMLFTGKIGFDSLLGPVGTVSTMSEIVEESKADGAFYVFLNLMNLAALISANLGVMNLLPIPALDGGRLVFLIIEALRGKPVKREHEGIVNFIGMILLVILMVVVLFKDIMALF